MEQCSPFAQRFGSALEARLTQIADSPEAPPRRKAAITAADARRWIAKAREADQAPESEVAALFRRLQDEMAVSGRVQPSRLARDADPEVRRQALGHLTGSCVVERREDTVWWILSRRPRCDVLVRLAGEGRLHAVLDGTLPETDSFGDTLKELLRLGAAVTIEGRSRQQLLELIAATELISETHLPLPDLAAMRARLNEPSALEEYTTVVPEKFVGRSAELRRLNRFLRETTQSWSGIVVTGLGGAGKSTLVAKFARDADDDGAATVVVLDFDRPGIDPRDRHWLVAEIMRQVGQQYPAVREHLRDVRHTGRPSHGWHAQRVSFDSSEVHLNQRVEGSLGQEIKPALDAAGAASRPMLVVLDTFEEVIQHGLADPIQKWLDQLSDSLYPTPLKVVYSGRLFDVGLSDVSRRSQVDVIELSDLDGKTAARLLQSYGLAGSLARRLVESDLLPRRPLELKLLARVLQEDPEASIERLEDELRSGGAAAKESFAALVYRRVLLRIRDPIVRKLAYPGLVLRYVTVDIIREVLAPALDLPVMDDAGARKLLEQLASCEWLAARGTDNRIWHRRDLRRSMLGGMLAAEPEQARKVSRGAIEYFERTDDRSARAEAMYHRLLYVRPDDTDPAVQDIDAIALAAPYIQADAADLSPTGAALLKFATGFLLNLGEIRALPWGLRLEAYAKTGASLVAARQFSTALTVSEAMQADGSIPQLGARTNGTWQLETGYAMGDWAGLAAGDWAQVAERLAGSALAYPLVIEAGAAGSAAAWDAEMRRLTAVVPGRLRTGRAVQLWRGKMSDAAVSRVLMNAILMSGQDAPAGYRELIERLLDAVRRRARRPATLVRRQVMARMAVEGRPATETEVPSPTFCLDPRWLRKAARHAAGPADRALLATVTGRMADVVAGPRDQRLVRKLLAAADSAASTRAETRRATVRSIRVRRLEGPDVLRLLRGPDPEFRDPARFALLDAYRSPKGRRRFGAILQKVIPLRLADLAPARFAETIASEPEYLLEDYIELADRTWRLGELLRRAHEDRPRAARLAAVHRAWETWDAAVRRALTITPQATART